MNPTTDVRIQAVLVSMTISMWSARKYDRKVTDEVNKKHGAADDAGRYNKMLLPGDADSYKALTKHLGTLRTKHYDQTLTWGDNGDRLLPGANIEKYRAMVEIEEATTADLLNAFIADYPALREAARIRLNGMFNDEDYPGISELRKKFAVSVDYSPVPAADFRCTALLEPMRRQMEAQLEARVARCSEVAIKDSWQRLYDCVSHLQERLAQPGAIFRDSLVGNVEEVCDVLARLNFTNDSTLERMRSEAKKSLTRYTPGELRDDDGLRKNVASSASDIMSQIRGTRRIGIAA